MNTIKLPTALIKALLLLLGVLIAFTALWSCQDSTKGKLTAPLLDNMGDHSLSITTNSELAQRFLTRV